MIEIGQPAPSFTLTNDSNTTHSLQNFKGQKLIVYFYPKDDTPGCTLESCGFRDHYDDFQKLHTQIIGISPDDILSHQAFRQKHKIPFSLYSDPDRRAAQAYGVVQPQKSAIEKWLPLNRSTFLIDERGFISCIWRSVSVVGHLPEVIKAVMERS